MDEEVIDTATGLGYVEIVEGTGASPKTGDSVSVHYTGWLKSGQKFDSSHDRGEPLVFPIGRGRVIKGWDEGVGTMRVGGKRKLDHPRAPGLRGPRRGRRDPAAAPRSSSRSSWSGSTRRSVAMARRVEGKAAIVVGGGQTPGETIGNGRATAIVLAREGARVLVVDRAPRFRRGDRGLIRGEGGEAWAFEADITDEDDGPAARSRRRRERFGPDRHPAQQRRGQPRRWATRRRPSSPRRRSTAASPSTSRAMWLACKHALPALRESAGSIVNISSMAARNAYPLVGYKTTKAAVVALTENLAAAQRQATASAPTPSCPG